MEPDAELVARLDGDVIAAMLYGSRSRGDDVADSDIDVLQLSRDPRPAYERGTASVAVYTPAQLRTLAHNGSLFVLHLRQEGRILLDPTGILQGILDDYRRPTDYADLLSELDLAAKLLDVDDSFIRSRTAAINRIGLYVLRSVLYAQCAMRGSFTFAMADVGRILGDAGVEPLFIERTRRAGDPSYCADIRAALEKRLGHTIRNEHGSIEALAVNVGEEHPLVISLAIRVLAGDTVLDYANLRAGA